MRAPTIKALVVDPRLLGDADRRHLVHLADIGEFQIIVERRGERVAGDDLALVVLGFGRGIAPDHPLVGDRPWRSERKSASRVCSFG